MLFGFRIKELFTSERKKETKRESANKMRNVFQKSIYIFAFLAAFCLLRDQNNTRVTLKITKKRDIGRT